MKRKRGKPVTHPRIRCIETGETYDTYKDAGEAIGGSRFGVRKVCEGTQSHHHGRHYEWIEKEDIYDNTFNTGRDGSNE